jgi:hypothetical protein
VIGTNASGTTSFYWNLVQHPQILPATTKEVHFYDRHWEEGLGWYRAHFPLLPATRGRITGEATPSYLFRPVVAGRVAATVPDAKLIALLRNPVDRAYGHYHKRLRKGSIGPSFQAVARAELELLGRSPLSRATLEARVALRDTQRGTPLRELDLASYDGTPFLLRGLYRIQLEEWFKHFPRDRFLILASEDYYRDSPRILREAACDFLGCACWKPSRYRSRNQGHSYPPMDPAIRAELSEFFRPHNEALYELLERDLGWDGEGSMR